MNLHIMKLTFVTLMIIVISGCTVTKEKRQIQTNSISSNVIEKEVLKTTYSEKKQATNYKPMELIRLLKQSITYRVNDIYKQNNAFLKYNDNQNFSMYVLPEYDLITEEPNNDILYYTRDDTIFMRIELLPDDIDWKQLKRSTILQLDSVSSKNHTLTSLEGKFLEQSAVYEASNNNDVVTAYFINKEDIKLKLTMFTRKGADHRDAFYQMAQTIMRNI